MPMVHIISNIEPVMFHPTSTHQSTVHIACLLVAKQIHIFMAQGVVLNHYIFDTENKVNMKIVMRMV